MNIKQIIKEEMDSFDWVDKVEVPGDELKYNHATVGMKVKLGPKHKGEFNEFNPKDTIGTVVDVFDTPPVDYTEFVQHYPNIQVQWPNGKKQYYYDEEVVIVGLSESFDWVEDVPPKLTVDQLKKGDIYIYNHPTGAQFRLKYNHAPGITNEWGTTTTYAFDWMKNGERINFNPKDIQRHIDTGKLVKESNDFDWAEDTHEYEHYHKLEIVVYEDDEGTGMVSLDSYHNGQYDYLFEGTPSIIMTFTLLLPKDEGKTRWDEIEEFQRKIYNDVLGSDDPRSFSGDYVWDGTQFNKL